MWYIYILRVRQQHRITSYCTKITYNFFTNNVHTILKTHVYFVHTYFCEMKNFWIFYYLYVYKKKYFDY